MRGRGANGCRGEGGYRNVLSTGGPGSSPGKAGHDLIGEQDSMELHHDVGMLAMRAIVWNEC